MGRKPNAYKRRQMNRIPQTTRAVEGRLNRLNKQRERKRRAQWEIAKQIYDDELAKSTAKELAELRMLVGFFTSKEPHDFTSTGSIVPKIRILSRIPEASLEVLFRYDKGVKKGRKGQWREADLEERGIITERWDEGWIIGVEATWDPAVFTPETMPQSPPTIVDFTKPGVLAEVITVACFDDPKNWNNLERDDAEFLMKFFRHVKNNRSGGAKSNGPWMDGGKHGTMDASGWRGGYDKWFKLGTYVGTMGKEPTVESRIDLYGDESAYLQQEVYHYWARQFQRFYPGAYFANIAQAHDVGLPHWGNLQDLELSRQFGTAFSSNLTLTHTGFANTIHHDHDKDVFTTVGCWMNTFDDQLSTKDSPLVGGNFCLPEYGLLIDFSKNKGLTWATWNGCSTWHFTTALENLGRNPGWDRFGSSAQISDRIYNLINDFKAGKFDESRVESDTVRYNRELEKKTRERVDGEKKREKKRKREAQEQKGGQQQNQTKD